MRTPLVAGNWKMYKTATEAVEYVTELGSLYSQSELNEKPVEIVICAPFTALPAAVAASKEAAVPLAVFAQNMHAKPEGAFTGEVSASMLTDLGVTGVVLGHSERRELFAETDAELKWKLPAALAAGLKPILCVGETGQEREQGDTERKLRTQVLEGLSQLDDQQLKEVVIAYEPIWAIGTGVTATIEEAQDAASFIRALLASRSEEAAQAIRILYGGSVKPDNAAELLAQTDIDGALVGGASLEPESFYKIVLAAL